MIIIGLCAAIGFAFVACDKETMKYSFPHKPHFDEEISCDTCHELGDDGVTLPTFEACLTCHEPDDETLVNCNACHAESSVELTEESIVSHQEMFKQYLPKGWHDVKFNHAEHVELDDETCLGCHGNVKESQGSTVANLPTMKEAMDFNDAHGISNECSVCHLEVDRSTPPASHDFAWDRKHGMMDEFTGRDSCLMCHEEQTCAACHRTEKPQNHTSLFRRKTHGIQAAFDRGSCLECHRSDECATCHLASAGAVPAASFHTPNAQCLACHAPQPNRRTPNRFLKPMPHRMMMGMGAGKCLQCHQF